MKAPKLSPTQTAVLQVLADGGFLETSDSSSRIDLYDRARKPQAEIWVTQATLDRLFGLGLIHVRRQSRPAHAILRDWSITERGREALAGHSWIPPETVPEIPEFRPEPPSRWQAEKAARALATSLRLTGTFEGLWPERISDELLEGELIPWWTELILDDPAGAVRACLEDLFTRDQDLRHAWQELGPARHTRAEILQKQVVQTLAGVS